MMAEGYYLLRERKQPDLDAPSRTVGLVETAPEAVRWCKNTPDDVSARHFEFVSVINSDEGNSPVSGVAESYVDVDAMANAVVIIDALLEFADEGRTPERLTEEDDWRKWVAKTQSRLREAIHEST